MASGAINKSYNPPRSLLSFFRDTENLVQAVRGPVGSGKTSAMCMRLQQLMTMQRTCISDDPEERKLRKSRWAIVRSTYSKIDTTTIPTWQRWFPEQTFRAPIKMGMPRNQHLRFALKDKTEVDAQILFLALESDADKEKLKSLEVTGIWFHEATEMLESVFDVATDRIKRYPTQEDGGSNVWKILLDFNPPDQEHWLYKTFEAMRPAGYKLWVQPPALIKDEGGPYVSVEGTRYALNPQADNLKNLDPTYYEIGKKKDRYVKIFYGNEYGVAENTTPVYDSYNDKVHYADRELKPYPGLPLLVGSDFGGSPSVVIAQYSPKGQLRVLDEVLPDYSRTIGIKQLIRTKLKPHLAMFYPDMILRGWGDPNGVMKAQSNERTCFDELNDPVTGFGKGSFKPAPFQRDNIAARVGAVTDLLTQMIDGEPALLISSRCPMLRAGFLGKYHYVRKESPGGSGKTSEDPEKSDHSHVHDALQYLCQGIKGRVKEDENRARTAGIERYNRRLGSYSSGGSY